MKESVNKMLPILQAELKKQPIIRAWLFGSYSRGEETEDSDVDILVEYDSNSRISLMTISRIMVALSEAIGKKWILLKRDICSLSLKKVLKGIKSWYMRERTSFWTNSYSFKWRVIWGIPFSSVIKKSLTTGFQSNRMYLIVKHTPVFSLFSNIFASGRMRGDSKRDSTSVAITKNTPSKTIRLPGWF